MVVQYSISDQGCGATKYLMWIMLIFKSFNWFNWKITSFKQFNKISGRGQPSDSIDSSEYLSDSIDSMVKSSARIY